ncbi:MAG: hypothetical protein KGH89_00540 [Thaumarchaeota archaeon]|nr:hypothetical protein [Nitrososphaerota archaeon]
MQSSAKAKKQKEIPELSPEVEKLLEDIDKGKIRMKKYTVDEYIKHVDDILKE